MFDRVFTVVGAPPCSSAAAPWLPVSSILMPETVPHFIGMSQLPNSTLPQLPARPMAELRSAQPPALAPEETSRVCSVWNHAFNPPPSASVPLKPMYEPPALLITSFVSPP